MSEECFHLLVDSVMKKAEGLQTQNEEEMLNKVSAKCIWRVQM